MEPTNSKKKAQNIYPIRGSKPSKSVRWKQLAPMERKLYIFIMILLGVSVSLLGALLYFGIPLAFRDNKNICLTERCVTVAGGLLRAMDESVNPCDDFYMFACGKWIKNNPVPESKGAWDQFDVLNTQLTRRVREILERDISQDDLAPVAMAKQIYRTCLDQEYHEGIEDLRKLVDEYVKDYTGNRSSLGMTLGRIRRDTIDDGNGFLISVYVDLEQIQNEENIIYIDSPALSLAQPYLLDENSTTFRDAYRELIETTWPMVYSDGENSSNVASEIIDFSTELAKIITRQEEKRNWTKLYNSMKLDQLITLTSEATSSDWEEVLKETFASVPDYVSNVTNWANITVIVRDLDYYVKLGALLNQTSPEVIEKYLRWCLIHDYAEEASAELRHVFFQYSQKTKGVKYPEPRWKRCSGWIKEKMGLAISYHYVRENFDDEAKQKVEAMVEDVRSAFHEILGELDWIEDKTRAIAEEKARKIQPFIAYPEYLKNNVSAMLKYYEHLKLPDEPSNFWYRFELVKWTSTQRLKEIVKPRDFTRWRTYATVVNAYYFSNYNSIVFPAGILQIPFYGYPIEALNYGAIGWVMGHEITHGFDDEGRQTDSEGRLVNWWDEKTMENFNNKAKCFIEQYGNYYVPEANLSLNGINTQGENIADNGGMQQAFRAYQYYKNRNGDEKTLPGLAYSPDQLFFISFAQAWCGSYKKETLYSQIMTGAHSPNQFRVIGTLQNSQDFHDVWSCPRKSNDTCRIW